MVHLATVETWTSYLGNWYIYCIVVHCMFVCQSASLYISLSVEIWASYLGSCYIRVAVAYIDFTKAFYIVCHDKFFHKLQSFVVSGNLLM